MSLVIIKNKGLSNVLTLAQTASGASQNQLEFKQASGFTPRLIQLIANKVGAVAYSVAVTFEGSLDGVNWTADASLSKTLAATDTDKTDFVVTTTPWKYIRANLAFTGNASVTVLLTD